VGLLVLVLFGATSTTVTYLFSFAFSKAVTAQTW
jgi:hypothetical protein